MGKEVVVTKDLSEDMIAAGSNLISELDRNKLVVDAALWLYDSESETWRLVIAMPEVKAHGPKKAYERVQSTIMKIPQDQPSIGLRDISIVDTKDSLISMMRLMMRTGPGISGIRASKNMINGVVIEDAYIYRLL